MRVNRKNKKAQVWISAVLYVLVIVAIIVIVIEALTPVIEDMKDKAVYNRVRTTFVSLNEYIKDISAEGQGSQRTIPIEVQKGTLNVEENQLRWKLDTEASILEPRTQVEMGNLIIVANGDVDAYRTNRSTLILRNSKVMFEFYKYGSLYDFENQTNSSGSVVQFTGSNIIKRTAFLKGDRQLNVSPSYEFFVPPDTASTVINGYTKLSRKGFGLGEGSVIAHINTSNYEYEVEFTLESQADYLEVELIEDFT